MQSSVATQVAGWFNQTEEINASSNTEVEIEDTIEEAEVIAAPTTIESTAVEVDKTIHSKGYSIVVGSFKENNADKYAADLAAKGMNVYHPRLLEKSWNWALYLKNRSPTGHDNHQVFRKFRRLIYAY